LIVLYVALTRAVEGLLLLKKPEGSIFDPIGVEPGVQGRFAVAPKHREEEEECVAETLPERLTSYGRLDVKGVEEEEKDLEAIQFGIALHYALEMMERFDAESLEDAMVRRSARSRRLATRVSLSR